MDQVVEIRKPIDVKSHRRGGKHRVSGRLSRNRRPERGITPHASRNELPYIARSPLLDESPTQNLQQESGMDTVRTSIGEASTQVIGDGQPTQQIRQELDTMITQADTPRAVVDETVPQKKRTELQPGDRLVGQDGVEVVVERLIGAGADALIYETTDGQAVKVFRSPSESGTDGRATPPEEEAAMMQSFLHNPDILDVFAFGVDQASEQPFMVMELVEGESLWSRAKRGPIPPEEVVQIMTSTARALMAMHRAGLVHRDVKPQNILLSQNGPKLTDFGIATHIGDSVATKERDIFGTPVYMAPERFVGEREDPRSDIYSFGVTAFRLLTGEHPYDFSGKSSGVDYYNVHLNDSVRTFAELLGDQRTTLHDRLERVVARALAKDPQNRYQDFSELLQHLERIRIVENMTAELPVYYPSPDSFASEDTQAFAPPAQRGLEVKRHKKPNPIITNVSEISGAVRAIVVNLLPKLRSSRKTGT